MSWPEPRPSNIRPEPLRDADLGPSLSPTSAFPETHKVGENDALGPMFQVFLINSEVHLDRLSFATGHCLWHTDNREEAPAGAVEWMYEVGGSLETHVSCPRLSV